MLFGNASSAVEWLVVGLGNPGQKYANTRHNMGFLTVDLLAEEAGVQLNKVKFKSAYNILRFAGARCLVMKPQTYMNLSGECIRQVMDYYKVDPSEFIVIYDDISLVPGGIRIRKKGSAGGHNGIKNIIAHLGTQEFPRVRIGVGEKPARMDLADYVLGHFPKEEAETMTTAFKDGAAAVVDMMTKGVEAAMNHFNGAARGEKEKLEKQKAERKEEVKTQ